MTKEEIAIVNRMIAKPDWAIEQLKAVKARQNPTKKVLRGKDQSRKTRRNQRR